MKNKKRTRKIISIAQKAEKALKIAVANAIEEHRRSGDPIVVWEKGRVVKIPASRLTRHR